MILVTGASGNVGGELVRALAARDVAVRAFGRTPMQSTFPSAVELAAGDLDEPDSLGAALAGVSKVFLLGGFPTLPQQLRRMEKAGIDHVVLLTSRCVVGGQPDNAITRMWLDSEAAVRDAGIPWTILRPSGFHSNALRWLPQLGQGDVVRAPWPRVPIASIDPFDIAAVAATALTQPGFAYTSPSLSGPEPLTPAEQVATLARALHRPLRYQALSDDEARAAMEGDTPDDFVDAFFRFFSEGEFDDATVVDTVHQITGQQPRTFEAWTEAHAHQFGPGG